jgi:hypothetical protein
MNMNQPFNSAIGDRNICVADHEGVKSAEPEQVLHLKTLAQLLLGDWTPSKR